MTLVAGQPVIGANWQTDVETLIDDALDALAWSDWPPTLTSLTTGSGSLSARHERVGDTVRYRFRWQFGAGSAVGTSPRFSLPATVASSYTLGGSTVTGTDEIGRGTIYDSSGGVYRDLICFLNSSGEALTAYRDTATSLAAITSTAPWTWATGDLIIVTGTYEAA